jgi:hypothetical protein
MSINHPGADDARQPPPLRRGTLPGGMAAIPVRASGEYSPTLRAPNPLQRQTANRPAPPSAVALARRTDPPVTLEPPDEQSPSSGRPGARDAEVARRARVQAESQSPGASYPPAIAPAPPRAAPAPLSEAALETAAIEGGLVWLAKRVARDRKAIYALVTALATGGGVFAIKTATETPPPVDTVKQAELAAVTSRLSILEAERAAALGRELKKDELIRCLRSRYDEAHQQTLPAPDKMGSAQRPRAWKDDCGANP